MMILIYGIVLFGEILLTWAMLQQPYMSKTLLASPPQNKNDWVHSVIFLVEAWYSLEQYIGLKEDKLSFTTVDFIRSEGNLETKCLYWFSKPKMC